MRSRKVVLALVFLLLVTGCGVRTERTVTLEFFQFKPEATKTFDRIIERFEAGHPGIKVVQSHLPNAETALRTRLVRGDVPDVMALNGAGLFGELARAGVFHDFAGHQASEVLNPAVQDILNDLGVHRPKEVNGLPFASNANGVIYNQDLFDKYQVKPPTTWDELISAAERFRAAGVTPFYLTVKDAWTTLPAFNALAANAAPRDFFSLRDTDRTTFGEAYPQVMDKLQQLFSYGQPDKLSRGYDEGNRQFAQGKAAMYLQGSYAIPAIRQFEPGFTLGTFPLPAVDSPTLVSGVDVAITMARKPTHSREAMQFVDFLMSPDVLRDYAAEQVAFAPLKDPVPPDPALAGLLPWFEQGRLAGYPDHHIPPSVQLAPLLQQFVIDGDRGRVLDELDDEWNKVKERQS